MLCARQRFIFAVVLLSHLYRDSTALQLNVSGNADIIKNEGDPLLLLCSGEADIFFTYPTNSSDSNSTSPMEIIKSQEGQNGTYKFELRRPKTVFGDTGWYGCSDHPIDATVGSYPDPDVTWAYVYVESNVSAFVEDDFYKTLHEVVGGDVVIPCRPTSPNLRVVLEKTDGDLEDDRVSFDPRIGFLLKNLTLQDSGYFKCTTERDGKPYEVNYHLYMIIEHPLNEPKIVEDTLRHVTWGQTLYVNCTVDVPKDMQYIFNWSTPQQSSRITTRSYSTVIATSLLRITNELIIKNVTYEDQGNYTCMIKGIKDVKQSRKYIQVHNPENKFINLTSQDPDRFYQRGHGEKVQWVVYVHAYPPPQLRWLNPKEQEILATWSMPENTKFAINVTPTQTILRINRLDLNDMGTYTLQAANKDRFETLNFTLEVIGKPVSMMEELDAYYAPNQTAKIPCFVAAFPPPVITWTFLKCPNYPSCEDGTIETLTNTTEIGVTTPFKSTVSTTIEMSGKLTCTACNMAGCDSVTENVLVTDVKEGFGIIRSEEPVIRGDDWQLTCAASIYNYSNIFEWTNGNDQPIRKTDRILIDQGKTQFSYRSTLTIKDVRKEDSQYYICIGRTTDNKFESTGYDLTVMGNYNKCQFPERLNDKLFNKSIFTLDAQAPFIVNTNLTKGETIIDLNIQGHKKLILVCYVEGMPKPTITWFKDDTLLLANNEQYKFFYDNQVLEMQYALEMDSGKYTCRAENRIGKVEAYQQLTIKGKGVPVGLIISIVVLVIVVVILIIYFTIKVRREKIMRKELMEAGLTHFEEGAVECLNPEMTVDDQAEFLPYDKKWEFPRERLKLGKQLGSGAFGVVLKAEAQGICEDEAFSTVAVKMVRRTTNPTYVRALASELKILVHLGKHLNVVNLLGACTKNISKRELLVIVEYCRFGNLHNYLLRHRGDFINQIDPTTGKFDPSIGLDLLTRTASVCSNNSISRNSRTDSVQYHATATDSQGVSMSPDGLVLSNGSTQLGWSNYRGDYKDYNLKPICTQDLLSWAFQVARGMEYLSHRKVLHGDLAARNILLAENNVVKICDFGLAKTMYKDENYKKKGDGPLPIKWLAIESIRDRIFSTQSDVWSFGIVLWEFFTLAETPYPGMEAEKQYQNLIAGYRMEQPEYATPEVYEIMRQCWKAKPTLRPSFTELVESIGDLLEDSVRAHYIQLNAPYLDMNTLLLEGGKNDYLTMLSAPDHTMLSSPSHDYANSPVSAITEDTTYLCMSPRSQTIESGIFSPRPRQERSHFDFPSPTSDSEDAVEISPMLKKEEEDPYLKPINVHERRAEFARNRQTMKNELAHRPIDRDSGYCNTPKNIELIDLNKKNNESTEKAEINSNPTAKTDYAPPIIRTQDNYVNMPQQKNDFKKDAPDGFSNPSYVIIGK
ncbi:PDGF- and VEGF-receptor related isoform X2 [Lasioglossum baleicum]|uniref:PDGF- and VEGF-receptor related isoform X2 n=1 Tax=Lasioglossum baleicum TaxID=434251 RepID=UPI003FCC56BC